MKIFATLLLVTLAVAAFAAETTDAIHARPIVVRKQQSRVVHTHTRTQTAKVEVSDLNEDDDVDKTNTDVLGDPLGEPIGATFGIDDDAEPPTAKHPEGSDAGSGSQDDNEDDSDSGSGDSDEDNSTNGSGSNGGNEESSTDGSGDNNDEDGSGNSGDGTEDGSGEGSSGDDSGDGSGVAAITMGPSASRPHKPSALHDGHNDDDVGLFDQVSSNDDSSSGSSTDDDELSSNSGSNDGSNGSNEEDDDDKKKKTDDKKAKEADDDKKKPTDDTKKKAADDKPHREAAEELAARVSADGTSFGLRGSKMLLLGGSAIGAAVGVLAVILGVVHLRRQQQRDERSTLAAQLPEPQTGRADDEAFDTTAGPHGDDELASNSIDLEEALTHEDDVGDMESEGAFVV